MTVECINDEWRIEIHGNGHHIHITDELVDAARNQTGPVTCTGNAFTIHTIAGTWTWELAHHDEHRNYWHAELAAETKSRN